MSFAPKISQKSKLALFEFCLLVFGFLLGFFVHAIGFNKRSQMGGQIDLYPLKLTTSLDSSDKPSRQWLKGYDIFFGQLENLQGDNTWGFVVLSPSKTNSMRLSDPSIPHNLQMFFSDGSTFWPIFVSPPCGAGATNEPIVIPIDSMSAGRWNATDISKMTLSFGN